ncbi:hypothetical protein FIV07_22540 [Mycobacterium sp. THAF192]|nr:hypothetical protein FIV07_22540 [Mycobacterium sp. THAF192]
MSNRKSYRGRRPPANRYRPPKALEYDEFVGELRLSGEDNATELHIRYGEKDDRYLDWSLTLNVRLGGLAEIRSGSGPLERRTIEIVDVSDSGIRRHVFDPQNPDHAPRTTRLVELRGDSHDRVNHEYQNQINAMSQRLEQQYPEVVNTADRHNTATIGFVAKNRQFEFRHGKSFGWVRNTVLSIDSDLADVVISDRAYYYFPTSPSTAGVLLPDGVMKFIQTSAAQPVPPEERVPAVDNDSQVGPMTARGDVTMGMLIASIYAGDWTAGIDDLLKDD